MADRKLFEYSLQDAWHMPISCVTILGDQNIVIYSLPEDGAGKFQPQEPKSVAISNWTTKVFANLSGIKGLAIKASQAKELKEKVKA